MGMIEAAIEKYMAANISHIAKTVKKHLDSDYEIKDDTIFFYVLMAGETVMEWKIPLKTIKDVAKELDLMGD